MYKQIQTGTVRSSEALTSAYVASTAVACDGADVIALLLTFTRHASSSSNTMAFKVEFSHDGTNYFQESQLVAGGLTAGSDVTSEIQRVETKYNDTSSSAESFIYIVENVGAKFFKFSAKETQDTTNLPTLAVDYVLLQK